MNMIRVAGPRIDTAIKVMLSVVICSSNFFSSLLSMVSSFVSLLLISFVKVAILTPSGMQDLSRIDKGFTMGFL